MELKKVIIGANRYFHKFRLVNDSIVETMVLKDSYDSLSIANMVVPTHPTYPKATYIGSATRISFDTPTGKLSDGEYPTQENGFHWVKIAGYEITKIDPKFIKNDILSPAGKVDVKERSVANNGNNL